MDFDIIGNVGQNIDACAQFFYKGKQISMSTIGRSQGGCSNPVAIFDGDKFQHHVGDFCSVQDAIDFINGDTNVTPIFVF